MSTHCERYPQCGCPENVGVLCDLTETEIGKIVILGAGHAGPSFIHELPIEALDRLMHREPEPEIFKISALPPLEPPTIGLFKEPPFKYRKGGNNRKVKKRKKARNGNRGKKR